MNLEKRTVSAGRKKVLFEEAQRKFQLAAELRSEARCNFESDWLEEYAALIEDEGRKLEREAEAKPVFVSRSVSDPRRQRNIVVRPRAKRR